MELSKKLLEERQKSLARTEWSDRKLSARNRDALLYVAYRSRGYLSRRLTRLAREAVVAWALYKVGNPKLGELSLGLWVVQLGLGALSESLSLAVRGTLIEHRRLKEHIFGWITVALSIFTFGALGFALQDFLAENPIAIGILVIKAVLASYELCVSAMTVEIAAKRRVFVPPLWVYSLVVVTAAGAWGMSHFPGTIAVFSIVTFHALLRAIDQSYSLRLTKRAEVERSRLEKSVKAELSIQENTKDQGWQRRDTVRLLLAGSSFPILAILILACFRADIPRSAILLFWSTYGLILTLGRRPFMAYSVDIVGFVNNHQWAATVRSLRSASRVAFVLLACGGGAMMMASRGSEILKLPVLVSSFALVAGLNQLCLMYVVFTNVDARISRNVLLARVVNTLILGALEVLNFKVRFHFGVGLICELFVLLYIVRSLQGLSLAAWLEHRFVENYRENPGTQNRYVPENFLMAYKLVSPLLRQESRNACFFLLQLRKEVTANTRMADLLDKMGRKFRAYDMMMAVDKQRILLWLPLSGADNIDAIRTRFLLNAPLVVHNVVPLSDAEAITMMTEIPNVSTRAMPNDIIKHVWTLSEDFLWANEKGKAATPDVEKVLDRLQRTAANCVFLNESFGAVEPDLVESRFRPLRALGTTNKVYELKSGGDHDQKGHALLTFYSKQELKRYLDSAQTFLPTVLPIRSYQLANLLQGMAPRLGWKLEFFNAKDPRITQGRGVFLTEIGLHEKRILVLTHGEAPKAEAEPLLRAS